MTLKPETILENAAVGVLGVDPQGIIEYANPQTRKLIHTDIRIGAPLKSINAGLAEQVLAVIKQGRTSQPFYINMPWGGDIEVQVSLVTTGKVIKGAVCFVRNLEQVQKEAWHLPKIKEMSLQFDTLMDHSGYGIYILDGKGVVLKVNDVAAGLVGFEKEEIIGMQIDELVERGVVDQALTPTILKEKKPLTRPLYLIKSDKYIMSSGAPIFDKNGEIVFVVVIEHNMTIVKKLRTELEQARQEADTIKSELSDRNLLELRNSEIIADSPEMSQVLSILLKLAKMDVSNILITGESGTGKGLLAKFIHHNSSRQQKPFISINCAALPEMLLEAELFGYEKGAFTGASDTGKAGLFELANQGSIFLDEIGDMPFSVQAKLLKCLDEGEIRRLGGTKSPKVDCTVIAATNQNLEELVEKKKFRQDLYFRLNTFPVHVPSLRKRREDILKISMFYLNKYNETYRQKKRFSEKCIEQLQAYDYPGNVRELKNVIKNAVVIKEKDVLNNILPAARKQLKTKNVTVPARPQDPETSRSLNEMLDEFERRKLEEAMAGFESTRDLADHLGTSQSTVVRKLKKHGLSFD